MMAGEGVVVGVDVGGSKKGFHAVALRGTRVLQCTTSRSAAAIAEWCKEHRARAIGVDAPCRWRTTGKARSAERELAAAGMFAFVTPDRETAQAKPFYHWMLNGAELYEELADRFPLLTDAAPCSPVSLETFPQAVACALAGCILSAKRKRVDRPRVLRESGVDVRSLVNIDYIDAALCAVAASAVVHGACKTYGKVEDGFVCVPSFGFRPGPR